MEKILVVEDEKMLGEMYQDKLKEVGFKVDLVFSSEEALDYLKKQKPTLILLDILLPRTNGIDFLKKAKETGIATDIPVVVISNYDDTKTKKEALGLGVKAYLIKTQYTPKELIEEITPYVGRGV